MIGAAVLAACGVAGGAYAATSGTSSRQSFLNDVAGRLHVTPQQLKSALQGALQDRLNAAVKAGRLTQAQADAIEKRIREGLAPAVPFFHRGLLPLGPGPVPLRPGLVPGRPGIFGGPLSAAAKYIGVSPGQLFEQLGSGRSLAQIAKARGKSVSGLENAIVSAERSRLDQARQRGLITSSDEQRILSGLQARVAALVNRTGFAPRLRGLNGERRFYAPPQRFAPGMVPPAGLAPAGPPPVS